MRECEVCGNPYEKSRASCPFCGAAAESKEREREFTRRTVNLELGRPTLDVALARLSEAIASARREGVGVLTLIHGYGSSGKGGVIRTECRKTLSYYKSKGLVLDYIAGEDYSRRHGLTKKLLGRYPKLKSDSNLGKANRGITLVILF